ncbi:sulfotransferase family 2 domain-containing protein [Alteromonas sp. NFXS44]|uniref:putative capsular polysaccharide synthesis family protein n=1 Tax=Alteromonas sp. NFXS44 TaxID=2818435 RepID=UPI0032DFC6A3
MKKIKFASQKYNSDEIILIYTPGKVGSSSLEKSLKDSIHTHTLYCNPPNPPHWKLDYYSRIDKFKFHFKQFVRRLLIRRAKKITIITVVREPISRNISMFFQALPFWLAYSSSNMSHDRMSPREEGFNYIVDAYQKNFNHRYITSWFDKEILRFSGINIYEHDPITKGLWDVTRGKYRLIVSTLENLSDNVSFIENALGQKIDLDVQNSGSRKWYSDIYKSFKSYDLQDSEINQLLKESKYYKKFYLNEDFEK